MSPVELKKKGNVALSNLRFKSPCKVLRFEKGSGKLKDGSKVYNRGRDQMFEG